MRDEILERGRRLDGRKFDEIRAIWSEVGVLPRVHGSTVFTRGETQALVTCTLGTAEDQQKIEIGGRRNLQALHAPLQLPAVLGGRSLVPARARPARDRPRRSRRARPAAGHSGRGAVPLHDPRRLRHPRVERIVVDGLGVRRLALDDGRRRAARRASRRRRDGPGDGRGHGQVRGAVRHRRRRGSLRRHGLQGRRHREGHHGPADGHQGLGHHDGRSCVRRSIRPCRGGCSSSARWPRRSPNRARRSPRSRRASSRSRFPWTRSATSSARAAR